MSLKKYNEFLIEIHKIVFNPFELLEEKKKTFCHRFQFKEDLLDSLNIFSITPTRICPLSPFFKYFNSHTESRRNFKVISQEDLFFLFRSCSCRINYVCKSNVSRGAERGQKRMQQTFHEFSTFQELIIGYRNLIKNLFLASLKFV